jgi:tetratricopeptide (TPR) repeat protein
MRSVVAPIRSRNSALWWPLFAGIWILLVSPSSAHENLSTEIAQATQAIRDDPNDPRPYLHRAELLRLQRRWRAALDDYTRAEALVPGLTETVLGRAALQLDAGQPRDCLSTLETLSAERRMAVFWGLKSRAHEMCGEPEAALDAQQCYVAVTWIVRPEDVLRRAQLGIAAGVPLEVVLEHLDAGTEQVGSAPALQHFAIDLELRLGNYDRALRRLDAVESSSNRPASLLLRRGDILERAGRALEARAAYTQALDHLETLSPDRRTTPTNQALERRLRALLRAPFSFPEDHAND